MVNDPLTAYVAHELVSGYSFEETRRRLLAKGYAPQDIEDAFALVRHAPYVTLAVSNASPLARARRGSVVPKRDLRITADPPTQADLIHAATLFVILANFIVIGVALFVLIR